MGMLGVLPGGGGTQRLPKLVGLPTSLDMALTGKTLQAKKAKKAGLVDKVVEALGPGLAPADVTTHAYLEEVSVNIARQLAAGKLKLPDRAPKGFVPKLTDGPLHLDQSKIMFLTLLKEKL